MRIKKQYETIVNLNAIEMYMANLDDIVLAKLRKAFEGRCFKSSLILKILRIIRRSYARSAQNLADGSGNVNVVFEADAIVYNENDIITDCTVKNVERSRGLICTADYAAIHIRGNMMLRGVQTGQTIPIRVKTVRYSKGKDSITINAVPYFHPLSFFLYKTDTTAPVHQEDLDVLAQLVKTAEEEAKQFGDLEKSLREFFINTFYPFKDKAKDKLPDKFSKANIVAEAKKLIAAGAGAGKTTKETPLYVARHPRTDKSTAEMFHINESLFKGTLPSMSLLDMKIYTIKVARESYVQILTNYLNEYIGYLRMVQEMADVFGQEEKRQKHKNIWAIYNRLKR